MIYFKLIQCLIATYSQLRRDWTCAILNAFA